MKRLSVTACVTLLCTGVSVLFATGRESTPIPQTTSTADAHEALTTGHNATAVTPANASAAHRPARVTATATADTAAPHTLEPEDAVTRKRNDTSKSNTTHLTTTSSALTATPSVHTSLGNTVTQPQTNKPTERKSPGTSADTTATATVTVSSLTSAATADASTSHLSSSSSSSTSASTVVTLTTTTSSTSEETPVFDHTSSSSPPVTSAWTSTTGPELSSTARHVSETSTHVFTSQSPETTSSTSITESPNITASESSTISTSAVSTSPVGGLVPHERSPSPSTPATQTTSTSTTATTTTPCEVLQNPPCSTLGVVKHCLITIACLAGLATIFMVSTIVLCTKLSARKYKVRRPQQSTEMMCISALRPGRNYNYTRHRSHVTNGVLVIPSGEDSDEEGGDNLTLSSFLPDNDRYV